MRIKVGGSNSRTLSDEPRARTISDDLNERPSDFIDGANLYWNLPPLGQVDEGWGCLGIRWDVFARLYLLCAILVSKAAPTAWFVFQIASALKMLPRPMVPRSPTGPPAAA